MPVIVCYCCREINKIQNAHKMSNSSMHVYVIQTVCRVCMYILYTMKIYEIYIFFRFDEKKDKNNDNAQPKKLGPSWHSMYVLYVCITYPFVVNWNIEKYRF